MKLLQESPNQKEFSSGELLTYMWEVPGSNLGRETDYPHRDIFFSFPKLIQEKVRDSKFNQIRTHLFHVFSNSLFTIIKTFDATYPV